MVQNWSYYAERLWHLSVPLEAVPEVAAWLVCGALTLWLGRFIIFRRPYACALSALAWAGWLTWQALCVSGMQAVYSAKRRGLAALEATDNFAQHLVGLVRAWTDFFLPFLSDVCRWAIRLWKKTTLNQRLIVGFILLSCYSILQAVRIFRQHRQRIMHVLFHLSFLVVGPLLWYSSGFLTPHLLIESVTHLITTFPTLISLLVISNAADNEAKKKADRRRSTGQSIVPSTNLQMQRLWLSYWACWPTLAVFEAGVSTIPKLLHSENSQSMQIDLMRALLTFVVWLQFWQGSRLLHSTFQSVLFDTSLLEYFFRFFGARGLWVLGIIRGGLWAGASPAGGMRAWGLIRRLTSQLWLFILGLAVFGLVMFALFTLFYRALNVVSNVATMLLWLCAASDSADTLTNDAEDFYSKKLSFWVLAMIWEAATRLPYVGVILRLFTPFAFSLWLLAGDTVLRRLILPTFRLVLAPVLLIANLLPTLSRPTGPNGNELTSAGDGSPTNSDLALEPAGDSEIHQMHPSVEDDDRSTASATGGAEDDVAPVDGSGTGASDPSAQDDAGPVDGSGTGGSGEPGSHRPESNVRLRKKEKGRSKT